MTNDPFRTGLGDDIIDSGRGVIVKGGDGSWKSDSWGGIISTLFGRGVEEIQSGVSIGKSFHMTEVLISTSHDGEILGVRVGSGSQFSWVGGKTNSVQGKWVVDVGTVNLSLSGWDNNSITSSGSTGSSTDFTDDHVQLSVLDEGEVLVSEESDPSGVVDSGPTITVVGTPRPALNGSSRRDKNLDLVTTGSFVEWNHSWHVETVVVSERHGSGGDVDLETSTESESTIVSRLLGSSGRESVEWETVGDLHVGISDGVSSLDTNVEMTVHLDGGGAGSGSDDLEEDITEFLSRGSESTSASDSGEVSGHIHNSVKFEADLGVVELSGRFRVQP